jgi:hypothetical protein
MGYLWGRSSPARHSTKPGISRFPGSVSAGTRRPLLTPLARAATIFEPMICSGGVLFIDRYTSVDRSDVILSHQWWADEKSLIRWRAHTQHRAIQRAGREQHFSDYRLRIGPAVDASRAASAARSLFVSYHDTKPATPVSGELFKSVHRDEKYLVVSEHAPAAQDASAEHKAFEITCDYTMHERAEAPQHDPPVVR